MGTNLGESILMRRLAGSILACAALAAAPALAQTAASKPAPIRASKDPAAAPAGVYILDSRQVGVVLRVPHGGGFSFSVFNMDDVSGVLSWNPADIEASRLNVKIAANSLRSNVPGLAAQLTGPDFLNAKLFPDAAFVSTSVKATGPTTGEITGNFTLHGVTKPLTLRVELIGAGPALRGSALGFHGLGVLHRSDFGVGPVSSVIGDDVEVHIDVEFDKTS
jgi:polyisoprenoid-binding protein YceI